MINTPEYKNVTVETIDRAIRDWFDKTVDARVKTPQSELSKVPVQFSQGERWSAGRSQQTFRDENGVLILPIIALRRTNITPDPTKMALGVQTKNIQIARRIDPKTTKIKNLEHMKPAEIAKKYPAIYDVYSIPYPDRMIVNYQLIVQTQYITQMNDIVQKLWRSCDIQKSFVAPFENDGRQPPRSSQFGDAYTRSTPMTKPYVVGMLEESASDSGNFEEFTDTERIIKYSTEIKVPCVLQTTPEGTQPSIKVERTAYKAVFRDENVVVVDDIAELDKIFGPLK